jgi:hypothetical protein
MRARTLAPLVLVAALATVSGCSSDPCDGKPGTCISARIEGNVASLTQLRISVDGAGQRTSPEPAGAAFSLPVKLAIVLPPSVTSPARVTIDALDGGRVAGTSGPTDIAFTPGSRVARTFTLSPSGGGPDMNGDRMDMGGDMTPPPGQISFSQTTFNFPPTERGRISPPQTTRISNRTTMQQRVGLAPADLSTQSPQDFDVRPDPACDDPAGMGVVIPANGECDLTITFKPGAAGFRSAELPLQATNGQMFTLKFQGQGLRGWVSMNIPGNPPLEAVSGFDNPLEFIAVGHDPNDTPIWIYDPANGWSRDAAQRMPSRNLFAVATVDDGVNRRLFVAGDGNVLYESIDGGDFASFPAPFAAGAIIRSIAVNPSKTKLYLVADGNNWARYDIATKSWGGPFAWPDALSTFVGGAGGIEVVGLGAKATGDGYAAALYSDTQTIPNELARPGAMPWPKLAGGWIGADGSNVPRLFAAAEPQFILFWANTGMPFATEGFTDTTLRSPRAIGGRWNRMANDFDAYAVGAFGPVITKRMNGTWSNITVPGNQARFGIWVSEAGDVVTIGFNGETTLFY